MGNEIFLATFAKLEGKDKEGRERQSKFHGKNFIYQYAVVSKLVERYFHCSWCQQVTLRSGEKERMAKKKQKKKLDSYDSNKGKQIQQVLLTHAH